MADQMLSHSLVHLDVRPKLAAYLVPKGRIRSLQDVIRRVCTRWGGIREPIVPTTRRGAIAPAFVQFVEVASPDVVFDAVGLDDDGRARASQLLQGRAIVPVELEERSTYGLHVLGVDIDSAAEAWASGSRATLSELAAIGALPSWDQSDPWEVSGVQIRTASTSAEIVEAQLRRLSLLEFGRRRTTELQMSGIAGIPPTIWVTAGKGTFDEVVWFWNLRALAPATVFGGPMLLLSRDAVRDPGVVEMLREFLGARRQTTPDVVVNSLTLPGAARGAIMRALGARRYRGSISFHLGASTRDGPLEAARQVDLRRFLLGERLIGARASVMTAISSGSTTVRTQSPVKFNHTVGGRVRIRISGPEEWQLPRVGAIAALLFNNAQWDHGQLEFESSPSHTYQFEVNTPTPESVLIGLGGAAGVEISRSPAGQLAQGLLRRAHVDVLASRPAILVVEQLTTPRSRALAEQIAQAGVNDPERVRVIAQEFGAKLRQVERRVHDIAGATGLNRPVVSTALERLVSAGLVQRGFRLPCSTCGLSSFLDLASKPPFGCPACGDPGQLERDAHGEPAFFYQLDALLDRASDQGVLPHLFGWAHLLRKYPRAHAILGANIARGGDHEAEVDFFGYAGAMFFCGEAKRSAGWFSESQIRRDMDLSRRLGASHHVMCCVDPVPGEARATAQTLAEEASLKLLLLEPETEG